MNERLEATLVASFPMLYRSVPGSTFDGCFGFGDGWEFIIRRVSARLEPLVVRALIEDGLSPAPLAGREREPLVHIAAIAKQRGRLRVVLAGRGITPAMRAAAAFAEEEASITCEACGAPGRHVSSATVEGTLCERHLRAAS